MNQAHLIVIFTYFIFIFFIAFGNHFAVVEGTEIYVNVSSTKIPLGTQSNPCKTLACGLRRSKDGDIIFVAPGLYTGSNNCNLCNATNCPSNFTVIGTGSSPSDVIISAQNSSSGRAFSFYNAVYVKMMGLTFQNFYLLQHLTYNEQLLTNTIPNGGGAITATQSTLYLDNIVFLNNSAAEGGALRTINCNVTISNSRFDGNVGGLYGGAFLLETSNLVLTSTMFSNNVAQGSSDLSIDGSGGALYAVGGSTNVISISSSQYVNNSAGQSGGAIYARSTSTLATIHDSNIVSISSSTFVSNTIKGYGNCLTIASCDAGGGGIYLDVPTVSITGCNFTDNVATTFASNAFAEGGGVFLTSKLANLFTVADISESIFTSNMAQSFGGGIYAVNQRLKLTRVDFVNNIAGQASSLFSDSAAAGGALWYSSQESTSTIDTCSFTGNIVFGGWGGAVFITNALPQIDIVHSLFLSNTAFSSYTFSSQGGAIMLSHQSQANITTTRFINNTAATFSTLVPNTFSGSGGALFVETTILYMSECLVLANKAISGQFDDGANGGGLLLENVGVAVIENVLFEYNSAEGFDGYSSYASSGSGGAISFKFATATIRYSHFYGNWVSVGGTHMSAGGAIAVYFAYTPTTADDIVLAPIVVFNCTFVANVAYAQLCRSAAVKAGQGGAIAIIGASSPGVTVAKTLFKENFAIATRTGLMPSIGGAVTTSLVSNFSCTDCVFLNNLAAFGIGNDVGSFNGQSDGRALGNHVTFTDSRFTALVLVDIKQYIAKLLNASQTLCSLSKEFKSKIDNIMHEQLGKEDMSITSEGQLRSNGMSSLDPSQLSKSMRHNWALRKFIAQQRYAELHRINSQPNEGPHSHHINSRPYSNANSESQLWSRPTSHLKQEGFHYPRDGHPLTSHSISEMKSMSFFHQGRGLRDLRDEIETVRSHLEHVDSSVVSSDSRQINLLRSYSKELASEEMFMQSLQEKYWRMIERGEIPLDSIPNSSVEFTEVMDSGEWRDEIEDPLEPDSDEEISTEDILSELKVMSVAEASDEHEHLIIRRQLRQKLKFLKTNYLNSPSVVITSGTCVFEKPDFSALYHVYVGDFVLLKNLFSVSSEDAPSSVTIPLLRTSKLPTVVEIKSVVNQETLVLSVIKAKLELSKSLTSALDLHRIRMFNATLVTSVDLTISGNCTIVDSFVIGVGNSTLLGVQDQLGEVTSNDNSASTSPLLKFTGHVHTGLGIQRADNILPDVGLDDNYFDPKDMDDIIDRAKSYLATVPLIAIDGCIFQIQGLLRLTGDWVNTLSASPIIHILLVRGAELHVMQNATLEINTGVFIEADSSTNVALVNDGTIWLNPLVYTAGSTSLGQISGGDISKPSQFSSAYSTLTVKGILQQSRLGLTVLTADPTHTSVPFLTLSTNYSYSGTVYVHLANKTTIDLPAYGANFPSNWTLLSFGHLNSTAAENGFIDTSLPPAVVHTIPGLLFRPHYLNLTGRLTVATSTSGLIPHEPLSESIVATNLACADIHAYYAGVASASTSGYCSVCSMNSSCEFCGGTSCVDKGTCTSGDIWSSCCEGGSCGQYGTCTDDFECEYDCDLMFRASPGCDTLSTAGTIVIFCIAFVFCFAIVALLYYRYYKEQKSEILEELRQNLLQPAALINSRANGKKSSVPQQFLEDLQQSLILKDVFVNYEDIKIDSKIGEGSFGVVYKAYFRGAQVAVKQMRSPLFEDITQHDIEEFRKEAYMMSRLRHPNIVLVMGISLVDIEPAAAPRNLGREDSDDDGFGSKLKPRESTRTVCIITEYLEQGSLADILYGPTRLPAEVFTYELILACALQAARGMLYLHSHSPPICHRDLKSSNLVVDDHWVVKVTDFGMSRIIPEKVQNKEMGIGEDDRDHGSRESLRDSFRSDTSSAGGAASTHPAHPARERPSATPIATAVGGPFQSHAISHVDYTPGVYSTPTIAEDAPSGHTVDSINISQHSETTLANRYSSFHPEMTSNLGTTAWCAPELLTATNTTRYSVKVDVYSFGMVLWELWEKRRPFDELVSRFDITDAIRAGKRPPVSESCPPAFRSIMQRCWQAEPARRPTFKYIERYLKEELARIRRQKHLTQQPGVGFGTSIASSYGTSDFGRRSSSTSRPSLYSGGHTGYHDSVDSADGRTTINILQRNSGDNVAANSPSTTTNAVVESMTTAAVNAASGKSNSSNSLGNSGGKSGQSSKTAAIPIVAPLLAPEGRTPLVAFDRSFSYLTAGSNTSTSSPLEGSSFGETPYTLMPPNNSNASPGSAAGGGYYGGPGAGVGGGRGWGPNQRLPVTPSGGRGPTTPLSSNLWRDKYVLRFSGWQASKPDAGLPPSLSTGGGPSSSSGASLGSGAGVNIPPRVSIGSSAAAQQSQPTDPANDGLYGRGQPLEAVEDGSERSSEVSGSVRDSASSYTGGNSYSFSPNSAYFSSAVAKPPAPSESQSMMASSVGSAHAVGVSSAVATSYEDHENAIFMMDHVTDTEVTRGPRGGNMNSDDASNNTASSNPPVSGITSALRLAGNLSGSNRSTRGATNGPNNANSSNIEPIPVLISGTGSGSLTLPPSQQSNGSNPR